MTTFKQGTNPGDLIGAVALARSRLTKAENQLQSAKEQARAAKRRRKEAKQAARRAKKQAKLAKREFAEASLALAKAEKKLLQAGKRAKSAKRPTAKVNASVRRAKAVRPVASGSARPMRRKRPGSSSMKPAPRALAKARGALASLAVPRDFEKPGTTLSTSVGQAPVHINQAGEGTPAGEAEANKLASLEHPAH